MREIWATEKNQPLFQSMKIVLAQSGSTLEVEFSLFSYWNFFTADRADTVRFYPEGKAYPRSTPNAAANFSGPTTILANGAFPFSSQYYEVRTAADTMTAIVVNTDADAVIRSDNAARNHELRVSSGIVTAPYQVLANGMKVSLIVDQADQWRTLYLSSTTRRDVVRVQSEASPNPLRLSDAISLSLPVNEPATTEGEVFLLSSSLDLVFSDHVQVTESFGNNLLLVSAKSIQSRVSSGIYFIVARVGGSEYRWKVAIIQ